MFEIIISNGLILQRNFIVEMFKHSMKIPNSCVHSQFGEK